jgi:hypothetical protein
MAFQVFYRGVSILCLTAVAGILLLAPSAEAQDLQLRGTVGERGDRLDGPARRGYQAYDPTSEGALPFEDALKYDAYSATEFGEFSDEQLEEAPARPLGLSTSVPEPRQNRRVERAGRRDAVRLNQRVAPVQGSYVRREDNPYAPVGFRVGTFNLYPSLEQGLEATSNASDSPAGDDAVLSQTRLQLRGHSDWSRHRLDVNGDLVYEDAVSGDYDAELRGSAQAALRIDISHSLSGLARLSYEAERESVSSPLALTGVDRQPIRHRISGEAGLEKGLGPLRFAVTGNITRDRYGDAQLSDGTELSQDDRNSTLALARLRAGYEISPALMPFIEVEGGRRFYDETYDSAGYERSATRVGVRAGVAVDIAEKLAGEFSIGWLSEDFDDDRLDDLSGLALAGSLQWSPMRGTNVFLDGTTTVEGGTGGDSGSLLYTSRLRVERALRSNLTGELALGADWRDYQAGDHDLTLHAEAGLTWWLNRYAGLVSRIRHERRTSSMASREYDSSSIFVGMRLQR